MPSAAMPTLGGIPLINFPRRANTTRRPGRDCSPGSRVPLPHRILLELRPLVLGELLTVAWARFVRVSRFGLMPDGLAVLLTANRRLIWHLSLSCHPSLPSALPAQRRSSGCVPVRAKRMRGCRLFTGAVTGRSRGQSPHRCRTTAFLATRATRDTPRHQKPRGRANGDALFGGGQSQHAGTKGTSSVVLGVDLGVEKPTMTQF